MTPGPRRWQALGAAMMYAGPLLAGMSRHSPWVIAGFAAILMGYNAFCRARPPWRVPGHSPAPLVAITLVVVTALSGLVFLSGRGLSVILGVQSLSLWLPLVLSAAGVGLARWAWPPKSQQEMDAFLEESLEKLSQLSRPGSTPDLPAYDPTPDMLERLRADGSPESVRAALQLAMPGDLVRGVVADQLDGPRSENLRRVAIDLSTDPASHYEIEGWGLMSQTLDLADTPELRDHWLTRAEAFLDDDPERALDLNTPDRLREEAAAEQDGARRARFEQLAKRSQDWLDREDAPDDSKP